MVKLFVRHSTHNTCKFVSTQYNLYKPQAKQIDFCIRDEFWFKYRFSANKKPLECRSYTWHIPNRTNLLNGGNYICNNSFEVTTVEALVLDIIEQSTECGVLLLDYIQFNYKVHWRKVYAAIHTTAHTVKGEMDESKINRRRHLHEIKCVRLLSLTDGNWKLKTENAREKKNERNNNRNCISQAHSEFDICTRLRYIHSRPLSESQ